MCRSICLINRISPDLLLPLLALFKCFLSSSTSHMMLICLLPLAPLHLMLYSFSSNSDSDGCLPSDRKMWFHRLTSPRLASSLVFASVVFLHVWPCCRTDRCSFWSFSSTVSGFLLLFLADLILTEDFNRSCFWESLVSKKLKFPLPSFLQVSM